MFWINLLLCITAIFFWGGIVFYHCKGALHAWLLKIFYRPPEIPKDQELGFTHIFPEHTQKNTPKETQKPD